MTDLPLKVVSETSQTITLGWDPPVGCRGYIFRANGKRSSTLDPTRSTVKFAKPGPYEVEPLGTLALGVYPPATPPPPPPPPPVGTVGWPRTFMINRVGDIGNLSKFDWVVSFPWMDVQSYHAQNPSGIAMCYPRFDSPPDVSASLDPTWTSYWHESSIHWTYQCYHNPAFPNVQEANSVFSWPGGTDTAVDGQAANAGTMRAWQKGVDDGAGPGGGATGTTLLGMNLSNTATVDLLKRLILNAAKGATRNPSGKVAGLYEKGWDGVWSDNVVGANSSRSFCDGLQAIGDYLRASLPGKLVGGNGAWEWRNSPEYSAASPYGGWLGTDKQGFFKMANVSLVEGWGSFDSGTEPSSALVDKAVAWWQTALAFPDPHGQPRHLAYWDYAGGSSWPRIRWGLGLSLVAGLYFQASGGEWADEYWGGSLNRRGWLGQPTGAAYKTSGVWRRDFDNGVALSNSSGSTQTVQLGGTFRKLTGSQDPAVNNGAVVSSVTINQRDGLVLSR